MAEDIRPAGIRRPRHLKPLSRESREEADDGRFRRNFEQMQSEDGEKERSPVCKSPKREQDPQARQAEEESRAASSPTLGRNLDVET